MTKYSTHGKSEAWFVPAIASQAAPTAAELNAGTSLGAGIHNLPNIPRTADQTPTVTLSSNFRSRVGGMVGGDVGTVEVYRDDSAEPEFDALPEGTAGFMVLGRKGLATPGTWAAADEADVFPAEILAVEDGQPDENVADFANISFTVTANPSRGVAVA